ncbi:hypothetical protein SERLADRAFT_440716 [Serpula lacrymans var. lacrymans S7.9]|uniref:DUF6532 domain-containing protein n=1 Tax=Serpula lacrymans var. lacrymans (strain S7.9) TaxID=578457 RepID=F8P4B9_SERL9|nr:uncharacterized protein SERLADRAFT_440716 [Serpula lacrymans var. lacrymans S7.9]EGO21457.1 hypothetical protein SERLADRAFT_440716 [Serpula lacrymans var. lacrymans S7.9]
MACLRAERAEAKRQLEEKQRWAEEEAQWAAEAQKAEEERQRVKKEKAKKEKAKKAKETEAVETPHFSSTSSRLAKGGYSQMCVILSTLKGFPGTDERDELVWNAIIKVASSSSLFKTTIVDLENARNNQKKGRIIDYVWAAAAQFRGEVKQKARILIFSESALKDKLPEEVHTIVEWLLSNGMGVFTFGGLDVSGSVHMYSS